MTTVRSGLQPEATGAASLFARAIETERLYFELGAKTEQLPGAVLAWMPGLTASPAAAVIHRADPAVIAALGEAWIVQAEKRLTDVGVRMARLYLDARGGAADELLRRAGYADRDELIFAHAMPRPLPGLTLRPVVSDEDWERKLRLHAGIENSPDGHGNRPAEWVALERRKCADGMDAFLAEIDGEAVGAIGAIWGDKLLRMKNIVVHPAYRRRSIGRGIVSQLAALGRDRGVSEHCVLAIKGEPGERLYRSAGMQLIGTQVEWSKPIESSVQ
jgi:ribosomal protein S18 acetylase RimI-like enzyme